MTKQKGVSNVYPKALYQPMTNSPREMTDTELRGRIEGVLEAWEEEGKGHILHFSYREIAYEIHQIYKEPVIIDGKTYHRKLVPDEWDLNNLCYAIERDIGARNATISAVNSQIKELE